RRVPSASPRWKLCAASSNASPATCWNSRRGLPMTDVSLFRLYLLRAMYLLIGVGLGMQIWPLILNHTAGQWTVMHSVAMSMLGALSALSLLGLRYPLQMLPLLFFELAWKIIWLAAMAVPVGLANRIDDKWMETVFACLLVAIVPIVLPWDYVYA